MANREPRTAVTSMRLSETGRYLLETLQNELGLSMASVVEFLVREAARERGIAIPGSGSDLQRRADSIAAIAAATRKDAQ